ncbi:MAG: hypothetical protein IPL83_02380 [Bdellovibrionales bacterium]|nr:hypothetical protein [Bdellovibrionales bacterium]
MSFERKIYLGIFVTLLIFIPAMTISVYSLRYVVQTQSELVDVNLSRLT